MTVSAVHSQLCRALEELESKLIEKNYFNTTYETYKKHVGMRFHTTCSQETQRLNNFPNIWFLTELVSSLYLWSSRCLRRFG